MKSPMLQHIEKRLEKRKWYDPLLELLFLVLLMTLGVLFWAIFAGGPK